MSQPPPLRVEPNGRRWLKSVLFAGLAILGGGILVLGIIYIGQQPSHEEEIRAEIERHLAALQAMGAPLTMEQLNRLYPDPPADRDAENLLAPAFREIEIPKRLPPMPLFDDAPFPRGGTPIDERQRTEIGRIVESNRLALTAVAQAGLNGAWFSSGFAGSLTNFGRPPVMPTIHLARLLCLDAALKVEDRENEEAVRSLVRALQIGKAIRGPAMIWHLCRTVVAKAACATLQRILNRGEFTEPQLERLAAELAEDPPKDLREVLGTELTSNLTRFELWRSNATRMVDSSWTPIDRLLAERAARKLYRDEDFLSFLEWQDAVFASFRLSSRLQLEWLRTNAPPPKPKNPTDASLVMQVWAPMRGIFSDEARMLGTLRLARTAIAIERWRLKHQGRLPDSLKDLVPGFLLAVPADPFDDQPLRYRKLERGYLVYSIGADFADDRGKEKPQRAKEDDHFDIPFTVER